MPGQYYDAESGLHYNWHRYYDPELGRYITSDPLGLYDGPSTYGYAHQNPVNKFDPNGQSAAHIIRTAQMAWNMLRFGRPNRFPLPPPGFIPPNHNSDKPLPGEIPEPLPYHSSNNGKWDDDSWPLDIPLPKPIPHDQMNEEICPSPIKGMPGKPDEDCGEKGQEAYEKCREQGRGKARCRAVQAAVVAECAFRKYKWPGDGGDGPIDPGIWGM